MSPKSKFWGKKGFFKGKKGKKRKRYGSPSKQKDSPLHRGFKQHESSNFVESAGQGDVEAVTPATCSSTKTESRDMRQRDDESHPSASRPSGSGAHPRDPRPQFWEAAKKASSLCLPSKRPIHVTLSHPERESFEGWRPLKKTRPGSFYSQSHRKNGSQETTGKKPRLSWGDGLAKFEKTQTNDVSANKDGDFFNPNLLVEKTTSATGFATPSFGAFTGVGDMMSVRAANVGNSDGNLVGSPCLGSQNQGQGILERIDANSFTSLSSSLAELLESVDPSSEDYSLARSTAMNKLVIWKAFVTNVLEVTETEIDSLENELKSLQSKSRDRLPCSVATSSLLVCHSAMSSNQDIGRSDMVTGSKPLQIAPLESNLVNVQKLPLSTNLHGMHSNSKEDNINNLGIATSKILDAPLLIKAVSSCDTTSTCSKDLGRIQSATKKCFVPYTYGQVACVSSCGDGNSSSSMNTEDVMNANPSASFYFGTENTLYDTIISSNRESAKRASEAFAMLLPKECGKISNVGVCSSSLSNNDAFIKEKLAERKRFERFKEMVLTIKYKAFNHLWEKDLCLRSTRKCPSTSHSNLELDLQTISKGCKKNRSSMRHRFPFPGGKQLSLVPTSEMISYTSQLLSEISHHEVNENILKMPTLILDKRDKIFSMFTSSNGLVDDPLTIEKERSMINPWTFEERNIFLEKFVAFGKDFRKISSFLDHKTTADCVEFYYKNHKSDFFEKTKKTKASKYRKLRTTKNSLMASSKKRNRKENVDSLQILNEAPVMARRTQGNRRTRPRKPRLWKGCDNMKKLTGGDRITERSSLDVLQDERERVAADALVSLCDSRSSSKAVITRSVDPVEAIRDKPCLKMRIQCQQPVMSQPDVTQDIDHGTRYDEGCGEIDDSDWTNEEKATFLQAVSSFGKDFTMIAKHVGTKSKDQCKIFFIKGKKWPGLNLMHHKPDYNVSPVNDLNSGRNDKDDGCVVVADTIIGSDKSGTKTNGDEPSSSMNLNDDESKPAEAENLSTDINESKELEAEVDHEDGNMASNSCALNSESASEKTPRNVVLKLFGKTITIPLSSQKSDLVS